jgi:Protein of unknown function (DUF3102)
MSNVVPMVNRAELANQINDEHARAVGSLEAVMKMTAEALTAARNAGSLLLAVKHSLKHGEWLPWLEANVQFTPQTATKYMKVAKSWEKIEARSEASGKQPPSIRQALKLLTMQPKEEGQKQSAFDLAGQPADNGNAANSGQSPPPQSAPSAARDTSPPKRHRRGAADVGDPSRDALGNELPERLRNMFADESLGASLDDIRHAINIVESAAAWAVHMPVDRVVAALTEAHAMIAAAVPFCICPDCDGAGCHECLQSGYLVVAEHYERSHREPQAQW